MDGESWAQHALQTLFKLEHTGAGQRLVEFQSRLLQLVDKKNKAYGAIDLSNIKKKLHKGDYFGQKNFLKDMADLWGSVTYLQSYDNSDSKLPDDLQSNFWIIFKSADPSSVNIDPIPTTNSIEEEPILAKRKSSLSLTVNRKGSIQQINPKALGKKGHANSAGAGAVKLSRPQQEEAIDMFLRDMPQEDQLEVWDILTKHNPSMRDQLQVLMSVSELSDRAIEELWNLISRRKSTGPTAQIQPKLEVHVAPSGGGVLGVNGHELSGYPRGPRYASGPAYGPRTVGLGPRGTSGINLPGKSNALIPPELEIPGA